MKLDIKSRKFSVTGAMRKHIENKIRTNLQCFGHKIRELKVTLCDINANKGGIDKRCSVRLFLPRAKDIVINDTKADLYAAIDSAIRRAQKSMHRAVKRKSRRKKRQRLSFQTC